jgi:hypothetical protein
VQIAQLIDQEQVEAGVAGVDLSGADLGEERAVGGPVPGRSVGQAGGLSSYGGQRPGAAGRGDRGLGGRLSQ